MISCLLINSLLCHYVNDSGGTERGNLLSIAKMMFLVWPFTSLWDSLIGDLVDSDSVFKLWNLGEGWGEAFHYNLFVIHAVTSPKMTKKILVLVLR